MRGGSLSPLIGDPMHAWFHSAARCYTVYFFFIEMVFNF
jgi:hypothetical protein